MQYIQIQEYNTIWYNLPWYIAPLAQHVFIRWRDNHNDKFFLLNMRFTDIQNEKSSRIIHLLWKAFGRVFLRICEPLPQVILQVWLAYLDMAIFSGYM